MHLMWLIWQTPAFPIPVGKYVFSPGFGSVKVAAQVFKIIMLLQQPPFSTQIPLFSLNF